MYNFHALETLPDAIQSMVHLEMLVPGLSINNSESENQWFLFFEKN
jgi:hypothetical protein